MSGNVICICDGWKKSWPTILSSQLMASNNGIKYQGDTMNYCAWCGNKLLSETAYEEGLYDEEELNKRIEYKDE